MPVADAPEAARYFDGNDVRQSFYRYVSRLRQALLNAPASLPEKSMKIRQLPLSYGASGIPYSERIWLLMGLVELAFSGSIFHWFAGVWRIEGDKAGDRWPIRLITRAETSGAISLCH